MKRLTRVEGGYIEFDMKATLEEVEEALFAYEETGLTSEQIREIDKLYREKCEEVRRLKCGSYNGSTEEREIMEALQTIKNHCELGCRHCMIKKMGACKMCPQFWNLERMNRE